MKKLILSGFAALFAVVNVNAQDLEQAKKSIDAEKFSEARKTLKALVASAPDKGKNYFYLGQVYLALDKQDSAKVYFDKGKAAKDAAHLNLIGLGHLDLLNGDKTAAEANFASALAVAKKKDVEEQIFISKAYLKAKNPDAAKAVAAATKAVTTDAKSAHAHLALGEAQVADKNLKGAYRSFESALELDKTFLKALVQQALLRRLSHAFPEALKELDAVTALNANYGPAYREKAETNMQWAYKSKDFDAKVATALEDYKKYMSLTDVSSEGKVKYADFLILTKKWKDLETVATEIQKTDKNNVKIYRYLGYAAFENGNVDNALTSLTTFLSKTDAKKIIATDYLYLGKIKLAQAKVVKGTVGSQAKLDEAIADFTKALEMNANLNANSELSDIAFSIYKNQAFLDAVKIYELLVKNENSKSLANDNYVLGNAILFHTISMTKEEKAKLTNEFPKGIKAYEDAIKASPSSPELYYNKARLNRVIDTETSNDQAVIDFEGYVKTITARGETEMAKQAVKDNLLIAYTYIGANYAATDKTKAIVAFEEALKINPQDAYVKESLQVLKK